MLGALPADLWAMGLYDRDYMRQRVERDDPYYDRTWESKGPVATRRRSRAWLLIGAVGLFGVVVLPHLNIAGYHWTLWLL